MLETELPAGRELDTLIADRITGWQPTEHDADHVAADGYWCDWCSYHGDAAWHLAIVPPYSTDIAAAWQVVERLHAQDYWVTLTTSPYATVKVDLLKTIGSPMVERTIKLQAEAETAPLAIC